MQFIFLFNIRVFFIFCKIYDQNGFSESSTTSTSNLTFLHSTLALQENKTMSSSTKITKPQTDDVIPGAGNSHRTGNRKYVKLVDSKKKAFVLAKCLADHKEAKDKVVMEVYNGIQGRFLEQKNRQRPYEYTVMSKENTIKKIRKALSEHNKVMIDNMKKQGQIPYPKEKEKSTKRKKNDKSKASQVDAASPPTKEDWKNICKLLDIPRNKRHKTKSLSEPLENDVIIGCEYFSHPGSRLFLSLIKEHKKDYILAKDAVSEAHVIQTVFDEIKLQSPPGRFIKISEEDFFEISKSESLEVIETALSENRGVILAFFQSFRGVVRSLSDKLSSTCQV